MLTLRCPAYVRKVDYLNTDHISEIRPLIRKIFLWGAAASMLCWLFTLIWGFRLNMLLGFIAGYFYMCGCTAYLGYVCEKAVTLDKKKASRSVTSCYMIRFFGMFIICAVGMFSGKLAFVGVVLPQLFPKIILSVIQFTEKG